MARGMEEAIRVTLETEGREGITDLRKALAELGNSGELAREQVGDLSAEVLKFADAAAEGEGIQIAIKRYGELAAKQGEVTQALEAARLKLEVLAAAEGESARSVEANRKALDDARASLAAYESSVGKTADGLAEQRQRVNEASAALTASEARWGTITASVADANKQFNVAYDAQAKLNDGLQKQGDVIRAAGLSTDDLADAQAELSKRIAEAGQRLTEQVNEARGAAAAQRELAEQTKQAAAEMERAEKALSALESESRSGINALRTSLEEMGEASKQAGENTGDLAAELRALNATDKVVSDFVRLKATLGDTDARLATARAGLAQLNQEFGRSDSDSRRASDAYRHAEQQVQRLTRQQQAQTLELQRASGALAKAGVDANSLGNAQQVVRDRMSATSQKIVELNKGLSGMGSAANSASVSVKGVGQQFDVLQFSLTKIAGLAAAAAGAIKGIALGSDAFGEAVKLEQQLAEVQSVAGGAAEQMAQLRDAAQQAAANTGMSMDAVTSGMAELARAGLDAEQTVAALKPTLDLAQGAGVGLAQAVEIATTTLTQFGMEADEAQRVADVLAQSANSSQSSVQGLGNSLSYVAPLAAQLGMNLEETTAVLSALADEGFRGERAGTALRNVFSQMMDPSSQFRAELEKLGITGNDFGKILEQLAAKGEEGKRALLTLDAAARPAVLALFNKGGEAIRKFTEDLNNAEGAAARTAATVRDTLGNAWARFKQTADNALTNLIGPLLKPLQAELETLAARIDAFAKSPAFAELRDELTTTFTEGLKAIRTFTEQADFSQIARDLTNLIVVLGNTVRAFNDMADELTFAADLAMKISVAAQAVETLRNGLGGLANVVRDNRDAMDGLTQGMGMSATGARDMSASLKAAEERMLALRDGAKPAADAVQGVGEAADGAADKTAKAAEELRQAAVSAFTQLATSSEASSTQIREAFSNALDSDLTKEQVQRLQASLRVAFEAGVISAEEMGDALTEMSDKVAAAGATIEALARRSAEVWTQLQTAIKEGAAPEVIERLQAQFDLLTQRIKDAERAATGMGQAMGDAAGQTMTLAGAFETLKLKSQEALNKTRDDAALAFNTISAAAKEGKAATEDVARAFEAYARAAQEAARYSNEATQRQVDAQLRLKGSALGLMESLERLGLVGKDAGDKTADAMGAAAESLHGVAEAADAASSGLRDVGSAGAQAASSVSEMAAAYGNMRSEGVGANVQLSETSKLFQDIVAGRARSTSFGPADLFSDYQEQNAELSRHVQLLQEQNMSLDEVGRRVLALREQYTYLSDDRLRALAQEQLRYEQAAGQNAEQNRMLGAGNELLRERNDLLNKQMPQPQQSSQVTKVIEVRLTAAVGRVEFRAADIQRSEVRELARLILEEIKRDM